MRTGSGRGWAELAALVPFEKANHHLAPVGIPA